MTATATDPDDPMVAKMEIYIDSVLKASNTNSNTITYSWNTTTYTNGQHTIYSKGYDAAGNVGTSSTITVTVNNTSNQLIQNGGFETGNLSSWTFGGVYVPFVTTVQKHSGSYSAQLGASSGLGAEWQLVDVPDDHHSQHGHQRDVNVLVLAFDHRHHHLRLAGSPGAKHLGRTRWRRS